MTKPLGFSACPSFNNSFIDDSELLPPCTRLFSISVYITIFRRNHFVCSLLVLASLFYLVGENVNEFVQGKYTANTTTITTTICHCFLNFFYFLAMSLAVTNKKQKQPVEGLRFLNRISYNYKIHLENTYEEIHFLFKLPGKPGKIGPLLFKTFAQIFSLSIFIS